MSDANISYKGFTIKRWGAFYLIEGRVGRYTWLKDAKAAIDWMLDSKNKSNIISFLKPQP